MNDRFYGAVNRVLPEPERKDFDELISKPTVSRDLPRRMAVILVAALIICLTAGAAALTMRILDLRKQWEKEQGPMNGWTLEDKAAFSDEAQRLEQIWENPRYRTPEAGEISKEQAKKIALDALMEKYGLTAERMSAYQYQEELTYYDPDFPEDGSYYGFTWIRDQEIYAVQIDPKDGAVLLMESAEDMAG